MGIEAIGSIGTAMGSVASGIGKAGAGVAPTMASFGEAMKAPLGNIVNEVSVRGGLLEGFRPMNITDITTTNPGGTVAPLGEILFNAQPDLNAVNVVAEAESIIMQAQTPNINIKEVFPVILPRIEPMIMPLVRTVPLEAPVVAAEARVISQPVQEVFPAISPALREQEVEKLVEEEEKTEKQDPKESLEEDIEIEKQMYLEDENVSYQRKVEIREAIVKARAEADRLGLKKIIGWLVAKFLPAEHIGNRSQVIKKQGPDGSYQETVEEIAGAGEFESEELAVKRFNAVVAEKKPVKYGKNGTPVEGRDIARVFKYRILKPVQAYAEVISRVIKKRIVAVPQTAVVPATAGTEKAVKTEPTLKDFPEFEGVFQKSA